MSLNKETNKYVKLKISPKGIDGKDNLHQAWLLVLLILMALKCLPIHILFWGIKMS